MDSIDYTVITNQALRMSIHYHFAISMSTQPGLVILAVDGIGP